jgi:hypothetical protein
MNLELEKCREELEMLYSRNPRGRKAYDPVSMLRAMLLMIILKYNKITEFAKKLAEKPRLAIIAGFEPKQTPATSTFYLFIDRLEDGEYKSRQANRVKLSSLRKGKHRRNLKQEKATREKSKQLMLEQSDTMTQYLKEQLIEKASQERPRDYLYRLKNLLMKLAVIPSTKRGLLGDLKKLKVCGDGSALESGANSYGSPTCDCRKKGIYKCEHDRFYRDATANWGYDSYRDCYYFGHTFYQHCVSSNGHDLPVHINIGQASESDFTLSLKSLDRFLKASKENNLELSIYSASYDSGHDALGIYNYLLAKNIHPVISLNMRQGQYPKASGTADKINKEGIPLCIAGVEMRRHTKREDGRIYFNCPVKRPSQDNGQHTFKSYPDECPFGVLCQPNTKMGPVVYVRSDSDPRFYPNISRDSKEYKDLMALRTGCERSNSSKKCTYKLAQRPCRSAVHFLFRLYLISIIEHAKSWLFEDKKLFGDDWQNLVQLHLLAA